MASCTGTSRDSTAPRKVPDDDWTLGMFDFLAPPRPQPQFTVPNLQLDFTALIYSPNLQLEFTALIYSSNLQL